MTGTTDPNTLYNTGGYYTNGIVTDPTTAFQNTVTAANAGVMNAQFALGLCYYEGSGTAQDLTQAKHWFTLAANQGSVQAQWYLTQMNTPSS